MLSDRARAATLPLGEGRPSGATEPPLPLRVRITAALCLAVVVAFLMTTFASNLPAAATGSAVARVTSPFHPYLLRQDWRLFGPDPPAYQHETLLEVRYQSGARTVTSTPTDIEYAADDLIRQNPVLPSKMAAFPLAFERMSAVESQPRRGHESPARDRADRVLGRYASLYAESLYPTRVVRQVRVVMVVSPLRHAGATGTRLHGRAVTADTGWLPCTARVGH